MLCGGYAPPIQAISARFDLVIILRSFTTPVPLVHRSIPLTEPAPSGSAGASRPCRGCFPPSPASPRSGCLPLQRPATTGHRRRSSTAARSPSASWRTSRHGRSARLPGHAPGQLSTCPSTSRHPRPAAPRRRRSAQRCHPRHPSFQPISELPLPGTPLRTLRVVHRGHGRSSVLSN
jgi:hypothetical protein